MSQPKAPNKISQQGRPEDYRGPLSPEAIAEGINAAYRNALRLANDATLLLEAGRHPSAASLAALSIEESGKVSILRGLAVGKTTDEIKASWQQYRDHRAKNGMWTMPQMVADGARLLHQFQEVVERNGEHTALLNSVKQLGLYTDCCGNAHWSEPQEVIDLELARYLVELACLFSKRKAVTTREIELWVEHLAPVWKTADMSHALLRWANAMQQEGLSDTSPADYARFVFGEVEASKWAVSPPHQS